MKKLARSVGVIGTVAALSLVGVGAAQAAPTSENVSSGSGHCCQLPPLCNTAKYLHYAAEEFLDFAGLQPIFGLIDKPYIHTVLWSPIDMVTGGCGADTHPPELSNS